MNLNIIGSNEIPNEILKSYEENKELTENVLSKTEFFHGTGALKYDKNGSVNEAVDNILKKGITPNEERLSNFFGISDTKNVCFTRIGGYARVYASLFQSEEIGVSWQYKDRKWWITMLAILMIKEAIPSMDFWKKSIPRTKLWSKAEIESFTWNKEGKSDRKSYWLYTMLFGKSNISNNFPVVIGIKNGADINIEYPDLLGFRIFEARSINKIDPHNFSHIQVPLSKLNETKIKLKENNIDLPVLAIEWCEIHDSKIGYKEIIEKGKNKFR